MKKDAEIKMDVITEKRTSSIFNGVDFELNEARHEREKNKLIAFIIALLILFVSSNIGWIVYNNQFEEVNSTSVSQDNNDGSNNYVGRDGSISDGKTNN